MKTQSGDQESPDEVGANTPDALTLDETAKLLAKLHQDINEDTIARTRRGIEDGAPDEILIRMLLAEFVRRAPGIRKHMGGVFSGHTPDVVEFVASRIDAFLTGNQPDLMKAFGLTKSSRGPKRSSALQLKQQAVAAAVLELMTKGEKYEVACRVVAQAQGSRPRTVSDWYSEHHAAPKKIAPDEYSPAERMLIYRGLLRRSETSGVQSDDE